MQGSRGLSLALALALGFAATAAAQSSFTVTPARPTPADRPLFTFLYTTPFRQCNPEFAPLPTIAGNVITFHGTPTNDPSGPNCQGTYRTDWQIGPLPAGAYTAQIEISGLQIDAVDFTVGTNPPPPLVVTPADPNQQSRIHFAVSGVATSFCPPFLFPPVVQGTDIVIDGHNPLFPVNPSCQGPWTEEFSIPPLPPGTYQVKVVIEPDLYATQTLVVSSLYLPPALLEIDPRLPTTRDRVTLTAAVARNCPTTFGLPILTGDHIVLPATFGSPCTGPQVGHGGQATIGPLPAGAYFVELQVNGITNEVQGITVTEPITTLPLVDHRFAVTVDRSAPNGGGPAFAVPLTDESGYFWFFDATNVELTVKILDGRPVNGHYWVFVASMTNLPYTVKIEDLASPLCGAGGAGCPVKTYTAVQGVNGNFIDLGSL